MLPGVGMGFAYVPALPALLPLRCPLCCPVRVSLRLCAFPVLARCWGIFLNVDALRLAGLGDAFLLTIYLTQFLSDLCTWALAFLYVCESEVAFVFHALAKSRPMPAVVRPCLIPYVSFRTRLRFFHPVWTT